MRTHETTIGENAASVTCHYQFDSDGDLDALQVMFSGVDILDALTLQQIGELEDECREVAAREHCESKQDSLIDAYIYARDAA